MHRVIVAALAAVIIAGCSSGGGSAPEPAVTTTPAAATDPYQVWLERAPSDAPSLSRDDAVARAMLGCGQSWPPGTTDAVLAEVYADYIHCGGTGGRIAAVRSPDPARTYHCGAYFHGHTVRGYLVDMKGTLTHLAYVPPAETLELWRGRGISAVPCQR